MSSPAPTSVRTRLSLQGRGLAEAAVEEMLDGTETIDAVMNDPVVAEGLRSTAASA